MTKQSTNKEENVNDDKYDRNGTKDEVKGEEESHDTEPHH